MKELELFHSIRNDLNAVEQELQKVVEAPDPLITEASLHLLKAGGKRLRPAFALVAGKTCNYNMERLMPLAMALELIHMASLVHDDVIDDAYTRRGLPTVKANWGNQVSIYAGSYLFAQSLQLIARCNDPEVSRILADISVKMVEGEIQQIVSANNPQQTIRDYFYRIKRKTALLIAASCELGAVVCGAPDYHIHALERYGYYLGMAFQITDDILDFTASPEQLGKPVGSDLRQGIVTLPVIFALELAPEREILVEIIASHAKTEGDMEKAIRIIKNCGAIDRSFRLANRYLDKAKERLKLLPRGRATDSLEYIADFIVQRRY